ATAVIRKRSPSPPKAVIGVELALYGPERISKHLALWDLPDSAQDVGNPYTSWLCVISVESQA
ncbi:MAG: hypothetical protein ACRD22_20560, partial [Terriglobia bacterium]